MDLVVVFPAGFRHRRGINPCDRRSARIRRTPDIEVAASGNRIQAFTPIVRGPGLCARVKTFRLIRTAGDGLQMGRQCCSQRRIARDTVSIPMGIPVTFSSLTPAISQLSAHPGRTTCSRRGRRDLDPSGGLSDSRPAIQERWHCITASPHPLFEFPLALRSHPPKRCRVRTRGFRATGTHANVPPQIHRCRLSNLGCVVTAMAADRGFGCVRTYTYRRFELDRIEYRA